MEIKHKLTNEVLLTIGGDSLQDANLQDALLAWVVETCDIKFTIIDE